jgi:2,4'-dihydroxyacetophenone dioxygenase
MSGTAKLRGFENIKHISIPLPPEAARELVFDTADDDDRVWMPLTENVWLRPLLFNVVQGTWVNLLRAEATGIVGRHRHPAPVFGFTLDGTWGYLESNWIARKGTVVYEPAGETHTLVVHPDEGRMLTLFHNMGPLIYVDEDGRQTGYEDVFTRIAAYKAHYGKNGLGADFVDRLIR